MKRAIKRIGINIGGGYVAGINAVIAGTVLAAHELGWEVMGIRDGFDGLLFPERYPEGGWFTLGPQLVENLRADGSPILGNAARTDPFRVRQVNAENMVEEVDRSGDLIARITAENIGAVISIGFLVALGSLNLAAVLRAGAVFFLAALACGLVSAVVPPTLVTL